ncbi:MAG: serine/threonine protein kinase, partial [Planctomycetota bacterium]|nr:serine/threonine protein kinase [Planctomycetota bacterium]
MVTLPEPSPQQPAKDLNAATEITPLPVPKSGTTSAAVELHPGQIIGKCRIIRELGRGGMGAVYLAHHTTLDVPVAIKILPAHFAAKNPQFAERFIREGKLAAKLNHPHIVAVRDADRDPETGLYYLILEYVDGGTVRDLLKRGPLPVNEALRIISEIASALAAAHEHGVVHRDIKPDNIMLTAKGQAKLADLGLAKEVTASGTQMTLSEVVMGT